MAQDDIEAERVLSKVTEHIVEYCRNIVASGKTFHARELEDFVARRVPNIAPESTGRALRKLRQEGLVDYTVLDRRNSLYEVIWVSRHI